VNVRRLFAFLEHSIDRETTWAVFEPNGEARWTSTPRAR
jgi:Bacteriophage tail sheath protein